MMDADPTSLLSVQVNDLQEQPIYNGEGLFYGTANMRLKTRAVTNCVMLVVLAE